VAADLFISRPVYFWRFHPLRHYHLPGLLHACAYPGGHGDIVAAWVFSGMAFPPGDENCRREIGHYYALALGLKRRRFYLRLRVRGVHLPVFSISASFWTGFTCYVLAFLAFLWPAVRPQLLVGK